MVLTGQEILLKMHHLRENTTHFSSSEMRTDLNVQKTHRRTLQNTIELTFFEKKLPFAQ